MPSTKTLLTLAAAVALAAPVALSTTSAGAVAPTAASGSDAKVTIKRDAYGTPHIYAKTPYDLFRGYGYAVAQDRLFQMEMTRRSTQGTVSEVLGAAFTAFDKDVRTNSDFASIRAQLAALPKEDRDVFDGYAAGMNEWLAKVRKSPSTLLPKQFTDHGITPSTWTGFDVAMVWVGTMAYRYSDSSSEIPNLAVRQNLITTYGEQKGTALFDQIVWLEDPLAPTTVPRTGAINAKPKGKHTNPLATVTPGLRDVGVEMMKRSGGGNWPNLQPEASNLWIVGKDRAVGAKSVLLNGPQFQWFNPGYTYGIGLHGAGWDFTGSTPFAYPAVIFGTNGQTSWGATAGPMNVVDVYQERLNPANPRQYWYDGAWREMTVRTETITIKDAAPVTHEVLTTVHGIVTSVDAANGRAYSKKRSYSGQEVASLLAWAKMPKAHTFSEFQAYAAKFAISINWYYADRKGDIGYISPGRLPDRPANQDVRVPALGDGSMEWKGFLPPTANPVTYNPTQGFVANWNNQAGPGFNNDYGNWSVVDRDQEVIAAFEGQRKWTADQMWALNEKLSFQDLNLRYLAPSLRAAVADRPADDPVRRDVELVTTWDGQTRDRDGDGSYDGPQPAIMRAWLPVLARTVLADDLPASVFNSYVAGMYPTAPVETRGSIRPAQATKLLYNGILGAKAGVTQSVDFYNGVDPKTVLLATYQEALAGLRAAKGADPAGWTAPTAHMAYSYKNFLGIPQAGADEQLAGPAYMNRGTANHMASLGQGQPKLCIVGSPGQSGFIAPDGTKSPHYADQLDLFANFGCRQAPLSAKAVDAEAESVTVLP